MGNPIGIISILSLTDHVLGTDEELRGDVPDQVGMSSSTGFEGVREKLFVRVGASVGDTPVGLPMLRELVVQCKLGVPVLQ